jgi:hypothetical protein
MESLSVGVVENENLSSYNLTMSTMMGRNIEELGNVLQTQWMSYVISSRIIILMISKFSVPTVIGVSN